MTMIETMDGRIDLDASEELLFDVEDALSFWYRYGRHPYRSLGGMPRFMITRSDFRYAVSPRFWRFTLEQTETMLKVLWPKEADDVLKRLAELEPEH
ncbi:hypothetical protein QFZ53_002842 [Microbacterium natoriense]|uniref:Uncharacterized protein n=1 Tax=Microbacterium natoriense TaxID=284570 RepID=A0AAW8F2F7_9MICO|nr:hypothetical protein [Microbacterium natoriense]MDQ0648646.1 hypothetical protein [Microbacterium natoriense]